MERVGNNYNDYELLYLIALGSDEALNVMFNKYEGLIISRIIKFRIITKMRDDFKQEGLITLYKAINLFRQDKRMSFTNFFDLLLQRRFIDLLRKNYHYYYNNIFTDNLDMIVSEDVKEYNHNQDWDLSTLSAFEKELWRLRYQEHQSIKEISVELALSTKQIYSGIARIKQKLKKQIKKQ